MTKLAVGLSLVAVALSGFSTWWATRGSGEAERLNRLDAQMDELRVLATRLDNLEARGGAGPMPPKPMEAPTALAAAPRPAEPPASAPQPDPKSASEPTVVDLSKRLAALEEKARALESSPAGRLRVGGPGGAFYGGKGKFYGSMDDAQADLELSASQRANFDRVIADAKRDLDEIRRIPDDEGKTWEQSNQELMKGITDGSGKFDLSKMLAFRGKTIPGRTETYGQAEGRIRTDAKKRLRDELAPEQQTKFDQAAVEPLIGGGMGGPFTSVSVFSTTDDAGMSSK